ncbi:MAG: histidine phosphatase family protein [Sedimentisphaerales bacterium]|nr:histidine phosphatase family protein [Sedimentisphaerales bacterium]MBN2841902.1 histidine phosphatase family protein [Sedimentisphaerales bacterium]
MKRLIIIRSGSTSWAEAAQAEADRSGNGEPVDGSLIQQATTTVVNAERERRLQGTLPLPLSEQGKTALVAVAEQLKDYDAQCIFSSGNESSGPTAEFLADLCRLKCKVNPDLKEMNCGLWQGLRYKDIEKRYNSAYKQWRSAPDSICPPEGETFCDCQNRIEEGLLAVLKKSKGQTAIVVLAEIAAGIAECLLTDKEPSEFWDIADNPEIVRIFELDEQTGSKSLSGKLVK